MYFDFGYNICYNSKEVKLMNKIIAEIKKLFVKSIKNFLEKNSNMSNDCSERAKVHRIAHYLENYMQCDLLFKDYVVDCEYNKVLVKNSIKSKKLSNDFYTDDKKHNGNFMPDLIVHKRNTQENLLYCEFKNEKESTNDNKKISLLTDGNFYIQYMLGTLIVFSELNLDNIETILVFKENKNAVSRIPKK